jgi:predicted transcriptional regulator
MLGDDLRELRSAAGLKAQDLARALDLSPVTISRYECGRSPIPTVVALAARHVCQKGVVQTSAAERLAEVIREVARGSD